LTPVFGGFSLYDCCKSFRQPLLKNEIKDGRILLFNAEARAAPF
jgi:hypothetical protein